LSEIILLGTSACHLCEQAENLLQPLNILYKKIDIAEQEQWQKDYAIKIPVILDLETHRDLCWPFTAEDIVKWSRSL